MAKTSVRIAGIFFPRRQIRELNREEK